MSTNKRYRLIYVEVCLILIILLAAALFISSCREDKGSRHLIIQDPRNETIFYSIPVEADDILTLSYRHSVSRSMVEGTFSLTRNGKIKPETTSYTAYGPGLPVERYVEWKIENGVITVYHEEEPRESIRLWVTDITGETIYLRGQQYPLFKLSDTYLLLEIFLD